MTINDILSYAKITKSTLYEWIDKFSNDPNYLSYCDSRQTKRSVNRSFFPKKISDECLKFIIDTTLQQKIINANNLCKQVKKKFNIVISQSYIYRLLNENGITYKKAQKQSYRYSDEQFEQDKERLKKEIIDADYKLNFTDETAVCLDIKPDYGWSRKGESCTIKQPLTYSGKGSTRYSLVMTMDKTKIINYKMIKGTFKSAGYKKYMKQTIPKMGNNMPFMDNARIHTSKIVKDLFIKSNKTPIYNVPYSPQFNPIEYVFNTIKGAITRKMVKSESTLRRTLKAIVNKLNKNGLDGYVKKATNNLFQ